jgi:multicomponent Na+:H+ antiporter subunit E
VTTPGGDAGAVGFAAAAITRGAGFLCLWLAIFGAAVPDLVVGAAAAAAATWASLSLLPPRGTRLRPVAFVTLVIRFFAQSAVGGVDVARRSLDPALPLRPGFVLCPTRLAPSPARNAFCTMASLLPGTLPVGSDGGGALRVHCLDIGQDVPAQMAEEEAVFLAVLGERTEDG